MTDEQIADLLGDGNRHRIGIGGATRSIEVAGAPVFAKMISVVDRELAVGPSDTSNVFSLPPWYEYGVGAGSTGFSAWREIAAHTTVSDWVRNGVHESFPLLYHWRLIPTPTERTSEPDGIESAVGFWGGSPRVAERLRALDGAQTVAVAFVEHVPYVLRTWLTEQLALGGRPAVDAVGMVERDLLQAAAQMQTAGIVHFDAHLDNVLTDGERIVVTDFGLASSRDFRLDPAERVFLEQHTGHDVAYCAAELTNAIVRAHLSLPGPAERNDWLHRCAETGTAPGLPDGLTPTVTRLAPITAVVNDFCWELYAGRVTTPFPAERVNDAARRAGLPG